jgi:putative ABC transport system substrate-binding protein
VTAWPLSGRAQSSALPVVTLINARRADSGAALAAEFRKGLRQTGFSEGKDVVVEYHWLDGHYEEIPGIIDDAVRRSVAVIATPGNSPGSLAAKAATATIPIVFGVAEERALHGQAPMRRGSISSLARRTPNGLDSCMSCCPRPIALL